MDEAASLRQTVTHLFEAVRYSQHAQELEEAARKSESDLEGDLSRLESRTEEILNLVSSLKDDSETSVRELSRQVSEFLSAAMVQAVEKLKRKAKEELAEYRRTALGQRDKALKSLEAYLASDPIPVIENVVSVRLVEGLYVGQSQYECDGGMKYEFGLAAQNSTLFHQEMTLSRLGYDLKIPVRFSRAILKGRVPGFERLDQYVLADAETSAGRIRANFQKPGDGAQFKLVTSGSDDHGFVGLEYSDETNAVNVMNDPALSAHVDLETIRKAMGELVKELTDLAKKKVALLRLSLNGDEPLENINCYSILQMVLRVLGPSYRSIMKKLPAGHSAEGGGGELSLAFINDRLKVLGTLSRPVSQLLGLQVPA